MILSTHGIIESSTVPFDTSYQEILNYATAQGYTKPSFSQQLRQNKLMLALKAAGIWNKLDSFAVFYNDGSANFGLIDWKRVSLYTAVNSPTFQTNAGFYGDGVSSYIDTNFNPATNGVNYTLNNASRFLWNNVVAPGSRFMDGNSSTSNNGIYSNNALTHRINQGTTSLTGANVLLNTTGLIAINRTSSTNVELFDDTTQFSRTATSTIVNSSNQFILRGGTQYSTQRTAVYGMGASLVSENTDLYNALNAYFY
jgi:hypothetical protein